MITDAFDLQRFVTAQAPVMANVLAELRAGAKRSHCCAVLEKYFDGKPDDATLARL